MTIYQKLLECQNEMKVPKSQYNIFGKYKFRNCEDILEAAKPVCKKHNAAVFLSDKIVFCEGRHYIEATAHFVDADSGDAITVTALAREEDAKKGMDASQVTGSASSYARKYALNGLFDIDDTKDADSEEPQPPASTPTPPNTQQNPVEQPKEQKEEYKCCNCGRAFIDFTAKSGKFYSAASAYHMAEKNNIDGKARCNKCTDECGTKKEK